MPKNLSNINITKDKDCRVLISVCGNVLNCDTDIWKKNLEAVLVEPVKEIKIESTELKDWDSSFILLLYETVAKAKSLKVECDVEDLPENVRDLLQLAFAVDRKPTKSQKEKNSFLEAIGRKAFAIWQKVFDVCGFIRDVFGGIGRFFTFRSVMRGSDFFSAMQDCGPKAVAIVCLISFLVGLILAFVGSVQLQTFGAQIYVASLVTIGMCRIMGAIMVGIIMAGRTGSSYAATIGTMQVNEELDALQTMGLSKIDFLVLPRLFSLLIAMPILTMIADIMGMIGGAFVGVLLMNLPYQEYWRFAFNAFKLHHFLVGIFHGFCFGVIIALCGCYSGLKCGRNADSVGVSTTKSVVYAVVWMIVVTGIITVVCQELGI